MTGVSRGYKIFISCAVFLLGIVMIVIFILRFTGKITSPHFSTVELLIYPLVGIGWSILGVIMFRAVKKGRL